MDGLGIRPEMLAMARRLAAAGYYVVQPNLFYRAGRSPLLDAAKVFTDDAERAKLMGLIKQLTPDVVVRDAGAWLQFLSQQPQVKGSKVGAVGYCMGGARLDYLRHTAHQYPTRRRGIGSGRLRLHAQRWLRASGGDAHTVGNVHPGEFRGRCAHAGCCIDHGNQGNANYKLACAARRCQRHSAQQRPP